MAVFRENIEAETPSRYDTVMMNKMDLDKFLKSIVFRLLARKKCSEGRERATTKEICIQNNLWIEDFSVKMVRFSWEEHIIVFFSFLCNHDE